MIRRLRLKIANWSAEHIEDDSLVEFDDYRRRLQQEEATLTRINALASKSTRSLAAEAA